MTTIMTVDEVVTALGIRKVTIYSYLRRGLFPNAKKIDNKTWDIPQTDVDGFIPPKGEVSRGAPETGKQDRSDIMLECTREDVAHIRRRISSPRDRYLVLAYYAGMSDEELQEELSIIRKEVEGNRP